MIDYAAEWEWLRQQYIYMAKTHPIYCKEMQVKAAKALVNSLTSGKGDVR